MASVAAALGLARSPFPSAASSPLPCPSRFMRSAAEIGFRCFSGPSPEPESEALGKGSSLTRISTNSWCAGVGAFGFLETGYLTYLKLTNSEAFCAVGGGGCSDVLNSDYSYVFGVPLPLVGMAAYGLVALLSLEQTKKNLLPIARELISA